MIDPDAAAAVSGLQDFRAKVGESRPALILATKSPAASTSEISEALGIDTADFRKQVSTL